MKKQSTTKPEKRYTGKSEKINGTWYPVTITATSIQDANKHLFVGQRKSYGTVEAVKGRWYLLDEEPRRTKRAPGLTKSVLDVIGTKITKKGYGTWKVSICLQDRCHIFTTHDSQWIDSVCSLDYKEKQDAIIKRYKTDITDKELDGFFTPLSGIILHK